MNLKFQLHPFSAARCCTHNSLPSCYSPSPRANFSFRRRLSSLTSRGTKRTWNWEKPLMQTLMSSNCGAHSEDNHHKFLMDQAELKKFVRHYSVKWMWLARVYTQEQADIFLKWLSFYFNKNKCTCSWLSLLWHKPVNIDYNAHKIPLSIKAMLLWKGRCIFVMSKSCKNMSERKFTQDFKCILSLINQWQVSI